LQDPLVDDSIEFFKVLKNSEPKNEAQLKTYEGMGHAFISSFNKIPRAIDAYRYSIDFSRSIFLEN